MFTTRSPEPDASLQRVRRDAAIICLVLAAFAVVLMRGRLEGALGVLGGGALMAVSFAAIRGGVDAALRRGSPRAGAGAAFRFVARYSVMAVLAWAVLVPLRAHPLGVFAGVSAPVLAIGVEAVRLVRKSRDT
jgi:hypothetical protein